MKNPIEFEPGAIVRDALTGDVLQIMRHRKDGVTEMQHAGIMFEGLRSEWNSHNNPRFALYEEETK